MGVISASPSTVQVGEYVTLTVESYGSLSHGTEYYIDITNIGGAGYLDTIYATYMATGDPLAGGGNPNVFDFYVPSGVSGDIYFTLYLTDGNTTLDRTTVTVDSSGSGSGSGSTGYAIYDMGMAPTSAYVSIGSYEVYRYYYTPSAAGTLTWSASTGADTIGWISTNSYCSINSSGYPDNSDVFGSYTDDANGTAFSATATVSANTTYYLYVCCYGGGSGSVTLSRSFQSLGYSVTNMGSISTSTYVSIGSYQILRYSYTPSISGTLTWYASTGVDTVGWINSSTSCNVSTTGYPSSGYYIGTFKDDSNGSAFSATATVNAGTTYYLYVCCYGGGSGTVTLSVNVRPLDWAWVNTIAQGSQIKLTAAEWNNFTARINQFRTYKGLSTYSFTTAVKNTTPIEAGICNQARTAISAISGHGTLPSALVSGGSLYASFFNGLRDALNAIT